MRKLQCIKCGIKPKFLIEYRRNRLCYNCLQEIDADFAQKASNYIKQQFKERINEQAVSPRVNHPAPPGERR